MEKRMSNKDRLTIGVLFGGRSGEHEVSLLSARSVLSVLSAEKYTVIQIGITHTGSWLTGEDVLEKFEAGDTVGLLPAILLPEPGDNWLYTLHNQDGKQVMEPMAHLDVIFPVLHGTFGEDGTMQGLLELADIAYVGAGVLGSAVGMDKGLFKELMRSQQIPVLDSIVVNRAQIEQQPDAVLQAAEKLSAYPLFVKPANLGSSVGITKCRSRGDLTEGLLEAAQFDRRVLIERGLNNPREIEISVLGNNTPQVSVPGEIVPRADFYTYRAKYLDDSSELIIPAALPTETTAKIQALALQAYQTCDCSGMARVDFLVDRESGEIFLGEINTIPGFTHISMYPKLWEASGISYSALVDRLVELALERKADRDHTERELSRA